MKNYKYIFSFLLFLLSLQVYAYPVQCQSAFDLCKADNNMYTAWGVQHGDCSFTAETSGGDYVGTFSSFYMNSSTGIKYPTSRKCYFTCPTGQVVDVYGNCAPPAPVCTSPQVLDIATNTCKTPSSSGSSTSCTSGMSACTAARGSFQSGSNCYVTGGGYSACGDVQQGTSIVSQCYSCSSGSFLPAGSTTNSCDSVMAACGAKVQEVVSSGYLRLMQCEQRLEPSPMVCLADNSGTGSDARCMKCPNGGSASDVIYGNGTSLPDFTPKTSLSQRESDCKTQGGTWSSDGMTWTCTTSTGSTSYDANGNVKSKPQELNCGGDTGIACESTQLSSLSNLKDINKNIKDAFTLPSDAVDCSVGTQCYKDKEKSIIDSIAERTGKVPVNVLNMKDLIMGTYLKPFTEDKTSGTCNPNSFEPITFSFTSIDGKTVSYIQPLPGGFLCKLFAIVRIFLVTGALLVGFKTIVFAFVKAT